VRFFVFGVRCLVDREIFSVMPKLFATAVESHTATSKVNLYTLFINSHNLCDRIFMSVKRFFPRKRKLGSLNPII